MDLELIGSNESGLELISEYQLQKKSLLVTSHFIDKDVQTRCIRLGVKMVPKDSVLNIQVNYISNETSKEIVLIDDDKFTHLNWKRSALNNKVNLTSFYSVDEMIEASPHINKETPIYIDSNLGDQLKGEELSKQIFDLGFKNIVLATEARDETIKLPYWITGIQGKEFPV